MLAVRGMAVVLAVLALGGCDVDRLAFGGSPSVIVADPANRWEPWLSTDRTVYVARYTSHTIELTIRFRFENRSRISAAIPRCTHPHRPVLDKLLGGEWVEVFTPAEMCWGEPLVVGPGRYQDFSFPVQAGRPHTMLEPQFRTTQIPGIYRLRWDVYQYDAFGQFRIGAPFPIEYRVSNEFRITH
jgi:hypothetical protein